ncbi:tetratricopeptide repeat protein [Streptomyces sp. NPDC048275]|uniref:tetratricopeptide repeat protein n=1 Tax=Streptomyces sp. NPDC048275 TaxID=3155629 RepID=UPI0033F18B1D
MGDRAEVHLQLGAHDRALADADRANGLRPDEAPTLVCRGRALIGLGRFDEARADLDRALALSPAPDRVRIAPLLDRINAARQAPTSVPDGPEMPGERRS